MLEDIREMYDESITIDDGKNGSVSLKLIQS